MKKRHYVFFLLMGAFFISYSLGQDSPLGLAYRAMRMIPFIGGVRATNTSTGEVVTAQADKAIYDGKTQRFRFERSGQPVQVQWQEAPAKVGGK